MNNDDIEALLDLMDPVDAAETQSTEQESESHPKVAEELHHQTPVVAVEPAPAPAPAASQYTLLSELLVSIPPLERQLILANYQDALRRGVVQAVPIDQKRFSISLPGGQDKRLRQTLRDELVKLTPECVDWVLIQRRESRYASIAATGHVSSSVEKLLSGEDDFDRLAEIRRSTLKRKSTP